MSLNETLARGTTYSIAFLITQDGLAGTTMTLSNNDFLGNFQALGISGPMVDLLSTDFSGNDQDTQRAVLLGDGSGFAALDRNLVNFPHCQVVITPRDAANGWAVDADVDGVAAGRGELNIVGPAAASNALIALEFRHTYNR